MKLMASGDHHFDEHSRFDECVRVHDWIAKRVAEEKPDVFLSGGDVYERASTPRERAAVAEWLSGIADVCPVLITKGNHDRQLDCALLARLRTKHPIAVEEACGVHYIGGAAIAAVAWPNRASLAAMLRRPVGAEQLDDTARESLRAVLRGLRITHPWDGPRILLGHFMIDGSRTSLGQPLVGAELNVGLDDLMLAKADLVIASHIHCPQEWDRGGTPIVYCGSPIRTAFGELEQKSVVVAEFSDRKLIEWRRIPTPATEMLLVDVDWNGGLPGGALAHFDGVRGSAEIRLRYTVDADQRDAARADAEHWARTWRECGASTVKIEEVVRPTVRARAPEIAAAKTLPEKLTAYWAARRIELDEQRRARVLGRLEELEAA